MVHGNGRQVLRRSILVLGVLAAALSVAFFAAVHRASAARRAASVDIGVYINKGPAIQGYNYGNDQRAAQAVIDYINAHGGVGGRTINPIYDVWDTSLKVPTAVQSQTACSAFTQDHHVFAVVTSTVPLDETFLRCMVGHKVPLITDGQEPFDQPDYNTGYLYTPSQPSLTHWAYAFVGILAQQHWFKRGDKVGMIHWTGEAALDRSDKLVRSLLAKNHVTLTDDIAVPRPDQQSGASATLANMNNAVLKFQTDGVTRVLFDAPSGGAAFYFLTAARSQKYQPTYAFSSFDVPYILTLLGLPTSLFANGLGVGWLPLVDTADAYAPPVTAAGKLCMSIVEQAGQSLASQSTRPNAFSMCDALNFLKAAMDKAPAFTAAGMRKAVLTKLKNHFQTSLTFASSFGQGHEDGVSYVRELLFSAKCTCFKYTGRGQPIQTFLPRRRFSSR